MKGPQAGEIVKKVDTGGVRVGELVKKIQMNELKAGKVCRSVRVGQEEFLEHFIKCCDDIIGKELPWQAVKAGV